MLILQNTSPVPDVNPGSIFEIIIGPIRHAVLTATLDMNMAEILESHHTPEAIAHVLDIQAGKDNLVAFLDSMVSMGFAYKSNGRYANTVFAQNYLHRGSPSYLGELVENMSAMQLRNLDRIPELIRNGPPEVPQQEQLEQEVKWKKSVRHLACYHKAGMAERVAQLVSELPEYPGMRRMLDMGCGPGIMCMSIVKKHPTLSGVLCDLPSILDVAREELANYGMESRITTIDGDYNEVDFGNGYDLIWASHTLYYAKDMSSMARRIFDALNPGGVFVSFHEGLTQERTQPAGIVLSRLSLALEGQDVSFEKGEIASHLVDAGFASIEIRSPKMPMGAMELVIARKRK